MLPFRVQHSEKMKESARGNWDPWEGQQSFRPNPNGVRDCTTTLRWLLIGAERQRLDGFAVPLYGGALKTPLCSGKGEQKLFHVALAIQGVQ